MININNKENCCGCSACANICPKKCITMEQDSEGFFYPSIDTSKCINCGLCNSVCHFEKQLIGNEMKKAYAGYNKNQDVHLSSTSGGVFTALSKFVLNNHGVVYGVVMDDDCRGCHHTKAQNFNELIPMRSSKYIQSNNRETYIEVKKYLEKNIMVLYTGTPCQINGLKMFLKKDYENLFCVDVICHGVPSEKLWKKYVDKIEKKYKGKLDAVNFRDKSVDYVKFGSTLEFNSKHIYIPSGEFGYFSLFKFDHCLRPSCYQCKAKTFRTSDITIGDYWGIDRVHPELKDVNGVSAIIVRSSKGEKLINYIEADMNIIESNYNEIVLDNKAEYKSVNRPTTRDSFYINLDKYNLSKIEGMYLYKGFKRKIKKFLIDRNLLRFFRGGGKIGL